MSSARSSESSKNHYETLGIPVNADADAIRRAYRKLALSLHPDKHPGEEEEYTASFKAIAEAYATLLDPIKREHYDAMLGITHDHTSSSSSSSSSSTSTSIPTSSSLTSLMIFSEQDGRKTSLLNVDEAFEMLFKYFKLGIPHSKCTIKLASNQSAVPAQSAQSDQDMHANAYERFGVTGMPLCVVQFSIGQRELAKLQSALTQAAMDLKQGHGDISELEANLLGISNQLLNSISSLMVAGKLMRNLTPEQFREYENYKVFEQTKPKTQTTTSYFLVFTREDLIARNLIPDNRKKIEVKKPKSWMHRISDVFSRKSSAASTTTNPAVLAIEPVRMEKK